MAININIPSQFDILKNAIIGALQAQGGGPTYEGGQWMSLESERDINIEQLTIHVLDAITGRPT